MALRVLLRRIPVRSPWAPLLGPVHGVSPATVPRYLSTQSEGEQRPSKAFMEEYMESRERSARAWALVDAKHEEAMKAFKKLDIDQAIMIENIRRWEDDMDRFERNWIIFGGASVAFMLGTTAFLTYWAHQTLQAS